MFYESVSKRTIIDQKSGNDKDINERFIVENCELCSECEQKILEYWNGECDVISVKQSKIREFINERNSEDQSIFLATIEDVYIDEDGEEKTTKYIVGLFSVSVEESTKMVVDYMKQGMSNLRLTSIKKTKIIDVLK